MNESEEQFSKLGFSGNDKLRGIKRCQESLF